MSKTEHFSKHPRLSNIALCTTIAAVLGLGGFVTTHYMGRKKTRREIARLTHEIYNNRDAQHTYVMTATEFAENRTMQKTMDSLNNYNTKMFNNAQEEYFARINKKYPMGRFMNSVQIAQLNRTVMPYINKTRQSNQEVYNSVRKIVPFNAKSTLSEFEYVLHSVDIPAEKFAPLDMVVNEGFLFGFNDARQENLFKEYLDEISRAFSEFNENEPNFDIPENAKIKDEYVRNQDNITELKNKIQGNNFLIAQTLAQYGRVNDSLNVLLEKNRQKLR